MKRTQDTFEKKGAEFVSTPFSIKERLLRIKAIVCDWDGVFHSGYKDEHGSSSFSETDSMGINMLRFGFYLENKALPTTAIITGENNETAYYWADREHLDAVLFKIKNKAEALPFLKKQFDIKPEEILFVYDDILDLSLAKEVGLRFLVNKKANPLFIEYCKEHKLCDYITACGGNENALREISEVCLNLMGRFNETIDERIKYDGIYHEYITERNEIQTEVLTLKDGLPIGR